MSHYATITRTLMRVLVEIGVGDVEAARTLLLEARKGIDTWLAEIEVTA